MRITLLAAAFAIAAPALAQTAPPPPGTDPAGPNGNAVERVTLASGDSATFTLAPGKVHQLLHPAAANTPGAVTISFASDASGSTLTAVSHAPTAMRFSVMGDANGDNGFKALGEIPLPNDGSTVTKHWPMQIAKVNVGSFIGGPYGAGQQHRY